MPEGAETAQPGLRPVPVREIGGVIMGGLRGDVGEVEVMQRELEPGLTICGYTGGSCSYPLQVSDGRQLEASYGEFLRVLLRRDKSFIGSDVNQCVPPDHP